MGGAEEEWVKAAMTDDTMVVELLVRLHGAVPPPPLPPTLPLEWTLRQRRSRPVTINTKMLTQSQRASPSTPLSWSGGTSLSGGSGGGGGSEESSRPTIQILSSATRSKLQLHGDGEKAISKRSRKKKTLVELKDEENSLRKEKRVLKREIAALRVNLEKQRAKNEKLKRIKVELQPLLHKEATSAMEESVWDQAQTESAANHPATLVRPPRISGTAVGALQCSTPANADAAFSISFMLPDLNMPLEDPCPDVIL